MFGAKQLATIFMVSVLATFFAILINAWGLLNGISYPNFPWPLSYVLPTNFMPLLLLWFISVALGFGLTILAIKAASGEGGHGSKSR